MAKPCKVPGCPKPATEGRASCAEHHGTKNWPNRTPWMERYGISGSKWQKIRQARLEAAGFKCSRCGKRKPAKDLEIDHIRSRKDHSPSNLRVLCKECHSIRTKRQAAEGRKRYYGRQKRSNGG